MCESSSPLFSSLPFISPLSPSPPPLLLPPPSAPSATPGPSLKAPFKDSFYLREEYKSAAQKQLLVNNLRFRITVLAFLNLIFCPVIFIYQLLYSFFSYAELLKNQPGIFGRRRWSLYGHWYLRDFNELEHEFSLRLCRAYKPSVKYMDLFVDPIMTLLAKNIAFIGGSLLAVLLVMTVIQENLLTANNVLTVITLLGESVCGGGCGGVVMWM